MVAVAAVGMFALMEFALGALLACTPYLMRKNECFAVTVPTSAQADLRLVALKKRYAVVMLAVTAAFTAVAVAAGVLIMRGTEQSDDATVAAGIALECAAVLVPAAASFALMLRNRRVVQKIKLAEGWAPRRSEAVATLAEEDAPRAVPLAWSLLHVPVILGTLALGLALYPGMPDMLPMHADFAGNVNRWEPKSLASAVGFPVLFELFMAACFAFCHGMILRSKRPVDPGAPATSALAYGLFARAQSVFMLVTGLLVSGGVGVLFLLSAAGFVDLWQAFAVIVVLCVLVLGGGVAMSVVYGQAGSRVFKRMRDEDALLADEDEHWKLGVFYCNPDDASVILPERFGIGWTMNLARLATWAIIVGGIALTIAFVVAVSMLF